MKRETVFIELTSSNVVELFTEKNLVGEEKTFIAIFSDVEHYEAHASSRLGSPTSFFRTLETFIVPTKE